MLRVSHPGPALRIDSARISVRSRPSDFNVRPRTEVTPIQMPRKGQDPRSRSRRPRRRVPAGGGGNRAPVTEYDEIQEAEAARERNDLEVSDLREMSVNELHQVSRDLELDTAAGERKDDLVDRILLR